jgi:hypothetical protein
VDGMIVAIAHVGTRVFISQGPPLEAQEHWLRPISVLDSVENNVRFASMQSRKEENDR